MSWLQKFFGKKGETHEMPDAAADNDRIEAEIATAMQHCTASIKALETETNQIRKWAGEAIGQIYKSVKEFWYVELDNYETIKDLPENENVDAIFAQKLDVIVQGYREQIAVRQSKLNFFESLLIQYKRNADRLQEKRDEMARLLEQEKQIESLDTHMKRIRQMQSGNAASNQETSDSVQLSQITDEIALIGRKLNAQHEVMHYVDKLESLTQQQDGMNYASWITSEIEKLQQKIEHTN